jgi:transposase
MSLAANFRILQLAGGVGVKVEESTVELGSHRYAGRPEKWTGYPALSDAVWMKMAPHIIGDGRGRGAVGRDNRMFIEGVLWIIRTGSPWRDLPAKFGNWNNTFRRFSRWRRKGVWSRIFEAMTTDQAFEYRIANRTMIYIGHRADAAKVIVLDMSPSRSLEPNRGLIEGSSFRSNGEWGRG